MKTKHLGSVAAIILVMNTPATSLEYEKNIGASWANVSVTTLERHEEFSASLMSQTLILENNGIQLIKLTPPTNIVIHSPKRNDEVLILNSNNNQVSPEEECHHLVTADLNDTDNNSICSFDSDSICLSPYNSEGDSMANKAYIFQQNLPKYTSNVPDLVTANLNDRNDNSFYYSNCCSMFISPSGSGNDNMAKEHMFQPDLPEYVSNTQDSEQKIELDPNEDIWENPKSPLQFENRSIDNVNFSESNNNKFLSINRGDGAFHANWIQISTKSISNGTEFCTPIQNIPKALGSLIFYGGSINSIHHDTNIHDNFDDDYLF
ncbi:MAG: hypothetical protein LBT70_02715 [Holosporaceae bacterium]|nr:hypothetical protein [Holosporaceae bacterium]